MTCGTLFRFSMMEEVERRALAEPFELRGAEGVVEPQRLGRAIGVLDAALDRLPRRHFLQSDETDAVIDADAVVIRPVLESQRQEALLFQVGFVDARKAAGYDGCGARQPR